MLRPLVLAGYACAILFGVHAVVFRATPNFPGEAPVDFPANDPTLFFAWVVPALVAWSLFIVFLPLLWSALGRGPLAGAAVLLLFVGILFNLIGDGIGLSVYWLATAHVNAAEAARAGLAEGIVAARAAVSALLGPGILALFLGALCSAAATIRGGTPMPRWYGGLVLAWLLLNIPVGPWFISGPLNVLAFGALVFLASRRPAARERGALSPTPIAP